MNKKETIQNLKAKGYKWLIQDSPNAWAMVIKDKDLGYCCLDFLLEEKALPMSQAKHLRDWLKNPESERTKEGLYLMLRGYGLVYADWDLGGPGVEPLCVESLQGNIDSWAIEKFKRGK